MHMFPLLDKPLPLFHGWYSAWKVIYSRSAQLSFNECRALRLQFSPNG
jgi:hypothetical protein